MTESPVPPTQVLEGFSARSSDASQFARVDSIDIFRGLNVLLMIFVDNLGFVAGLPWWTNHMSHNANGMTYVDMVFPAFLFLMGMSIPLSLDSRTGRGDSAAKLWSHIFLRSAALIVTLLTKWNYRLRV